MLAVIAEQPTKQSKEELKMNKQFKLNRYNSVSPYFVVLSDNSGM
jgi:hypothetical protein